MDHGLVFGYPETGSPGVVSSAGLKFHACEIADGDPQQTRIFVLLACGVKAS